MAIKRKIQQAATSDLQIRSLHTRLKRWIQMILKMRTLGLELIFVFSFLCVASGLGVSVCPFFRRCFSLLLLLGSSECFFFCVFLKVFLVLVKREPPFQSMLLAHDAVGAILISHFLFTTQIKLEANNHERSYCISYVT